jgi:hypothetical protein
VFSLQVGTVYQLVITISILVSQILGLESVLGTEDLWPVLLAITAVPGLFQLATLPMCPESPKYLLLSKGQELEAQRGMGASLRFSRSRDVVLQPDLLGRSATCLMLKDMGMYRGMTRHDAAPIVTVHL